MNQVTGWRYMPDAHGTPPCGCPVCNPRGAYGAAKIRRPCGPGRAGPSPDGAAASS
jgi:hypothetical protein